MKLKTLTGLFFIYSLVSFSQTNSTPGISPKNQNPKVQFFLNSLKNCDFQNLELSASNRLKAGKNMDSLINHALNSDFLRSIILDEKHLPKGVLFAKSKDEKIRTYTWAVPMESGVYEFFGQVLINSKRVERLINILNFDENDQLDQNHWPGGLIYHIELTKYRGKRHYLSLSFRPSKKNVQMKIIEPIIVGEKNIYFGASVFAIKNFNDKYFEKPPKRLILRYSPKVSASIHSISKNKEIVIDNLGPMGSKIRGNYIDYGPNLSSQSIFFKRGKWIIN